MKPLSKRKENAIIAASILLLLLSCLVGLLVTGDMIPFDIR